MSIKYVTWFSQTEGDKGLHGHDRRQPSVALFVTAKLINGGSAHVVNGKHSGCSHATSGQAFNDGDGIRTGEGTTTHIFLHKDASEAKLTKLLEGIHRENGFTIPLRSIWTQLIVSKCSGQVVKFSSLLSQTDGGMDDVNALCTNFRSCGGTQLACAEYSGAGESGLSQHFSKYRFFEWITCG